MKKFLLLFALTLIFSVAYSSAQDLVSKNVQPRNAVLEEFTGIHCGYCPQGHAIANNLIASNPGRVIAINVHAGGYAVPASPEEPDFRTKYGDALVQMSGLGGYPAGQVNREYFNGSSALAMNRGDWAAAVNDVLGSGNSPVNIAAEATWIDYVTLEIKVEVYFTSTADDKNLLNIALLEDGVIGYQSDYSLQSGSNPNYVHKHILRDLVTGQWGEAINNVSKGALFTKTYTYTIPQTVNSVTSDLKLALFTTKSDHKYIYTGTEVEIPKFDPTFTANLSGLDYAVTEGGAPLTKTYTIENVYDNDITLDVSVEKTSDSPADWKVGLANSENSNFTLAPGETKDVDVVFTPGSTIGKCYANFTISNDMDTHKPYYKTSTQLLCLSSEIQSFEVVPASEDYLSLGKYVTPEGNMTYTKTTPSEFLKIRSIMPNIKLILWNNGYNSNYTDATRTAILDLYNSNIKMFITGLWSLSSMSTSMVQQFGLQFQGWSMAGYDYVSGTPTPYKASITGFADDPISGSFTSGIDISWTTPSQYYGIFCFTSTNENTTVPFLKFKNVQKLYLVQNNQIVYRNAADNETNFGFRVDDNGKKAVLLGMLPDFIGNETTRKTLINYSIDWLMDNSGQDVPNAKFSVNALDYGNVNSGKSMDKDIIISNTGTADLELKTITLSGDNPEMFSIVSGGVDGNSVIIKPNDSHTITVRFSPDVPSEQTEESFFAKLVVATNESKANVYDINLSGTGINPQSVNEDGSITEGFITLKVNPNPVSGESQLMVDMGKAAHVTLTLLDARGSSVKQIFDGTFEQGTTIRNLNASGLASGTYYLRAVSDAGNVLLPVVIVK